jgi:hypothetical protein
LVDKELSTVINDLVESCMEAFTPVEQERIRKTMAKLRTPLN